MAHLHISSTPVYSYSSQSSHELHVHDTVLAVTTQNKILVGAWDSGFFACFDFCVPNGLTSWLCPWVTIAQIVARLGIYAYTRTLVIVLGIHVFSWVFFVVGYAHLLHHQQSPGSNGAHGDDDGHENGLLSFHSATRRSPLHVMSWFLPAVFGYFVYVMGVWRLRTRVRHNFQISGSRWLDCIAASFCSCCTIAQVATHVKSYTPGSCAFGAPLDTLPAYP